MILPCEGDDEDAYSAATDRIVTETLSLAERSNPESIVSPGRGPTAIVVWEGGNRGEGDLTARFAALAENKGMRVLEVATLGDPDVDRP